MGIRIQSNESAQLDERRWNSDKEDFGQARVGGAGMTRASTLAGTGTSAFLTAIANHPGIFRLTFTANGDCAGETTNGLIFPNLTYGFELEAIIRINQLSTATNEFYTIFGLVNGEAKAQFDAPTHGVFFQYLRGTSTNWLRCTANGSSVTRTSTGIAVTASAWTALKIVMPAGGTQVDYYIGQGDGVAYVHAGTNTANILDATDSCYLSVACATSASDGAAKTCDIDLMRWKIGVSR